MDKKRLRQYLETLAVLDRADSRAATLLNNLQERTRATAIGAVVTGVSSPGQPIYKAPNAGVAKWLKEQGYFELKNG